MICKWCGAKVREKDRTCPRCGQELPPLSECGGFYDLVPGARAGATPPPAPPVQPSQPVQPMPPTDGPTAYYPHRKKKQDNSIVWLCVWIILMAVVIALLIQSCTLSNRLDDIDKRLSQLSNSTEGTSEDTSVDASVDTSEDPEDVENTTDTSTEENTEETTGETPNETTDETTDETKGTTEEPTGASAKNEIELTLDVDADGKIELSTKSEKNGWMFSKCKEDFYIFECVEHGFFLSISCSEDDDGWTLKCDEPDGVTCSWQWQTKGTNVMSRWTDLGTTMEGYTSVCPKEYNAEDSLQCILTWNLKGTNEYNVTVTINFDND